MSACQSARFTGPAVLFALALAAVPMRPAAAEVSGIDLVDVPGGLYVMGDPGGDANEAPSRALSTSRRPGIGATHHRVTNPLTTRGF